MNKDLSNYLENIKKPWGILFYRVVWEQLRHITDSKVLDFGSGFGFTASHLAINNSVIAVEPNADMVEMRIREHHYDQIIGDLETLKKMEDHTFDVILCHNVLEYVKEPKEIFKEFYRLLKPNGMISIIKHNHAGRIMQKVVFENNVSEAMSLLDGGGIELVFGQVNYYDINDIVDSEKVSFEKVMGVRTFWGLQQNNEIKNDPKWQDKMFDIEMKVSNIEEYINISFFNHLLIRNNIDK